MHSIYDLRDRYDQITDKRKVIEEANQPFGVWQRLGTKLKPTFTQAGKATKQNQQDIQNMINQWYQTFINAMARGGKNENQITASDLVQYMATQIKGHEANTQNSPTWAKLKQQVDNPTKPAAQAQQPQAQQPVTASTILDRSKRTLTEQWMPPEVLRQQNTAPAQQQVPYLPPKELANYFKSIFQEVWGYKELHGDTGAAPQGGNVGQGGVDQSGDNQDYTAPSGGVNRGGNAPRGSTKTPSPKSLANARKKAKDLATRVAQLEAEVQQKDSTITQLTKQLGGNQPAAKEAPKKKRSRASQNPPKNVQDAAADQEVESQAAAKRQQQAGINR